MFRVHLSSLAAILIDFRIGAVHNSRVEIGLHTRSGEWDVTPPAIVDIPPPNPFSSFYQPSNPSNPFFPPLTSTPNNACAHLEDKVEDDANLPSTIYVHADMFNASHPAPVDPSLTHAMTH